MKSADSLRIAAAEAEIAASRAKALVENPTLRQAFERVEAQYIAAWKDAAHTIQREDLFFRMQGLKAVQADLAAVVSGGQVAAYNTRHLQK